MKKPLPLILLFFTCLISAQESWHPMITDDFNHDAFLQAVYPKATLDKNDFPYVVYEDGSTERKCTVQRFNGLSWELVGPQGFSAGHPISPCIALNSNNIPYVAYKDESNGKINVRKFNGASWELVGTEGFTTGIAAFITIAIDHNNVPYLLYAEQTSPYSNQLTMQKFNGISWELVGTSRFSQGTYSTEFGSIAIDSHNTPYVAYSDFAQGKGIVQKFNGTSWEVVGQAGFSDRAGEVSMSIGPNDIPYVSYADVNNSYKSTVQKFNGTSWELVGMAGFSDDKAYSLKLSISPKNIPYLAYADNAVQNKITVKTFNGSGWQTAGISGFSIGESQSISLLTGRLSDTPFAVYTDSGDNKKCSIKKLEAGNWSDVGPVGISEKGDKSYFLSTAIDHKNVPYAAYSDPKNSGKCTVQRFNGKKWEIVGIPAISAEPVTIISLATDYKNTLYAAFKEQGSGLGGKATVKKFNGASWETIGNISHNIAGSLTLAFDHNNIPYLAYTYFISATLHDAMVQKFDGTNWKPVGTLGYTGGSFYDTFATSLVIDSNNIPYVSYQEHNTDYMGSVKRFTNNRWEMVGNGHFYPDYGTLAISSNDKLFLLHPANASSEFNTVRKFNGFTWEILGESGFCKGEHRFLAADSRDVPYIFFGDQRNQTGKGTVLKYEENNWIAAGKPEFSQGFISEPSIVITSDNMPIIFYNNFHEVPNRYSAAYAKFYSQANQLDLNTVHPLKSAGKMTLYPNPVRKTFSISQQKETITGLEIFDISGRSVYKSAGAQEHYDIRFLPKGVYIVKVMAEKKSQSIKIIKE